MANAAGKLVARWKVHVGRCAGNVRRGRKACSPVEVFRVLPNECTGGVRPRAILVASRTWGAEARRRPQTARPLRLAAAGPELRIGWTGADQRALQYHLARRASMGGWPGRLILSQLQSLCHFYSNAPRVSGCRRMRLKFALRRGVDSARAKARTGREPPKFCVANRACGTRRVSRPGSMPASCGNASVEAVPLIFRHVGQ